MHNVKEAIGVIILLVGLVLLIGSGSESLPISEIFGQAILGIALMFAGGHVAELFN